jgi:hypothetical protein
MSRDVTPSRYSALVVPFDTEIWPDHSTYTQAGPRAGVPVPVDGEGASRLALAARGTQTGDLQIRTQRGGFATRQARADSGGTLRLDNGAAFIWRTATTTGSTTTYGDWRGWDPPRAVTRYQSIVACDNTATATRYTKDPHAIRLASGNILVACEAHVPAAGSPYQVAIYRRSGTNDTWAGRTSPYGVTTAPTYQFCPTLCQLPSGRVLLYLAIYDSATMAHRLQGWFSDDEGSTWSTIGDGLTNTAFSGVPYELRVAYKDGQILLLARLEAAGVYRLGQYASSDLGNTFDFVLYESTWDQVNSIDIAVGSAGFVVIQSLANTASTTDPAVMVRIVPDAYLSIALSDPSYAPGLSGIGGGESAITVDETGVIYAYVRTTTDAGLVGQVFAYMSFDSGLTFTPFSDGLPAIDIADTAFPRSITVAASLGQVVMVGNATATGTAPPATAPATPTPTQLDDSLHCWTLGGYTELCLPRFARSFGFGATQGWKKYYTPIEYPGAVGWTVTTAATATQDITVSNRLVITTNATGTMIYTIIPIGTTSDGLMMRAVLSVQTRAAIGQEVSMVLRFDDGTQTVGIRAEFDTTQWRLVDNVSGGVIGVVQPYSSTSATIEVLLAIKGRNGRSWWRQPNAETEAGVRSWTTGPATTTLTTAATGAGDVVGWGHRAAGVSTSTWYEVAYADATEIQSNLADGQTSPNDLFGRPYSSSGDGVYCSAGASLEAKGGPTWLGESWHVRRRYDYGVERALTFPSPRHAWVATTNSETISLLWDDGIALGTNSYASRGLLAIYLGNCNAETVAISYRDVAGVSWVSLGTADRCVGLTGLAFDLMNASIRPTTDAGIYLRTNELAGSWFVDVTGATQTLIAGNSEGRWSSTAPLRTMLHLAATAGTTTGRTGGKIVPKDTVILVDLSGINTPAIKLVLAKSSTTAALQVGVLQVGEVIGLGTRYDWGRTIDLDLGGAEIAEARDRTRRALAAAPPRRTASIAWAETAIDQTAVDRDGDPDYLLGGAGQAVAGVQSTAYTVEGVAREIEGATTPIVYLPAIPAGGPLQVVNRRHQLLYGRVTSDISIESVLGEEDDSELVRVATMTIEEEV